MSGYSYVVKLQALEEALIAVVAINGGLEELRKQVEQADPQDREFARDVLDTVEYVLGVDEEYHCEVCGGLLEEALGGEWFCEACCAPDCEICGKPTEIVGWGSPDNREWHPAWGCAECDHEDEEALARARAAS
jgi:hypothetical protein